MKHVKILIKYGHLNPSFASVDLTTRITQEIVDVIASVEGVENTPDIPLGGYGTYFICAACFDKTQVVNNVRMALIEHFDKLDR